MAALFFLMFIAMILGLVKKRIVAIALTVVTLGLGVVMLFHHITVSTGVRF